MGYTIIGGDGQPYGPVTAEQLKKWIAEGRINAQTQIQAVGQPDWKPLSAFPELDGAMAPKMPPLSQPSPVTSKTSGLAIGSLVLGIAGFFSCGLLGLVGLILGLVGLSKINHSGGAIGGKGLAVSGIVVSCVSMLFLPVMAVLTLPALARARENARAANCISQIKSIGAIFAMYADTHNEQLPPAAAWCDAITQSGDLGNREILRCPSSTGFETCSYVFNANMDGAKWQDDPEVVVLICAPKDWNGTVTGPRDLPPSPHKKGYNVLFNDGHVEFRRSLDGLKWIPETKP